ncbi:MAG: hypothetical protein EZS28_002813, partial [Streblomastix strix]
ARHIAVGLIDRKIEFANDIDKDRTLAYEKNKYKIQALNAKTGIVICGLTEVF